MPSQLGELAMTARCFVVALACRSLLACGAERGFEDATLGTMTVAVGMRFDRAVAAIVKAGGWEFACGYRYDFGAGSSGPRPVYGWYTLPNGMSLGLLAEGQGAGKGRALTTLEVCDSTALFCCKGEQWFRLKRIELTGQRAVLHGLAVRPHGRGESFMRREVGVRYTDAEKKAEPVFLYKGMTTGEADAAIKRAGCRRLAIEGPLRSKLPERGEWSRYALPANTQLLMNVGVDKHTKKRLVNILVVEAPRDELDVKQGTRPQLDFEVADLRVPISPNWQWAFLDRFLWEPGNRRRLERAKRAGQRR